MRNETVLGQGPKSGLSAYTWETVCLPVILAWSLMERSMEHLSLRLHVQAHRQHKHWAVTTGRAKYSFTFCCRSKECAIAFSGFFEGFDSSSSNPLGACPTALFWRSHRGVTHVTLRHVIVGLQVLQRCWERKVWTALGSWVSTACSACRCAAVVVDLDILPMYHATRVYLALNVGVLSHTYFSVCVYTSSKYMFP